MTIVFEPPIICPNCGEKIYKKLSSEDNPCNEILLDNTQECLLKYDKEETSS